MVKWATFKRNKKITRYTAIQFFMTFSHFTVRAALVLGSYLMAGKCLRKIQKEKSMVASKSISEKFSIKYDWHPGGCHVCKC
jgi:hypothetical protein